MIVGRVAALAGRQAWGLLGTAQALLIAAAVLAAFLIWRRLVPTHIALALSGTVLVGLSEPSKANEVLALSVFLPLLLVTFAPPKEVRALNPVVRDSRVQDCSLLSPETGWSASCFTAAP